MASSRLRSAARAAKIPARLTQAASKHEQSKGHDRGQEGLRGAAERISEKPGLDEARDEVVIIGRDFRASSDARQR